MSLFYRKRVQEKLLKFAILLQIYVPKASQRFSSASNIYPTISRTDSRSGHLKSFSRGSHPMTKGGSCWTPLTRRAYAIQEILRSQSGDLEGGLQRRRIARTLLSPDAPMRGVPKPISRFASLICLSRLSQRQRTRTRPPTSTTRSRTQLRLQIDRQKSPNPSLRSSRWMTCLVPKSRRLLEPAASMTPKPSLRPSSAPTHGLSPQGRRI